MGQHYEVAIIGGGPAGLSAALVLGRSRRSVIVIDEGKPRNRVTRESHGFLTRDGITPSELRRIAIEQLMTYPTVELQDDIAASIEGGDGEFHISTAQGAAYTSKKLIFATGMRDLPIEIEGLSEVYGRSAFVCPYCDGWEMRDKRLAIIAGGKAAYHLGAMLAGWTNQYFICTNGAEGLTAEERADLLKHQVEVYDTPIHHIQSMDGQVEQIVLQDGYAIACEGIFFAPKLVAGSDLPRRMGCETTEAGHVVTNDAGRTNLPGVYSAGDAASEKYQIITAASLGSIAAVAINSELLEEDWKRAIH